MIVPVSLLDEGINHLASRGLHGHGAFVLAGNAGEIRLSLPVPGLGGPPYLNLRAAVAASDDGAHIARAAVGGLSLPPSVVEAAIEYAVCQAGYCLEWRLGRGAIRKLSALRRATQIGVTYVWEAEILDRARSIALPGDDVARLREAQENSPPCSINTRRERRRPWLACSDRCWRHMATTAANGAAPRCWFWRLTWPAKT